MQLSSTGGKIVGFMNKMQQWIDFTVPKFSDLQKQKSEEIK